MDLLFVKLILHVQESRKLYRVGKTLNFINYEKADDPNERFNLCYVLIIYLPPPLQKANLTYPVPKEKASVFLSKVQKIAESIKQKNVFELATTVAAGNAKDADKDLLAEKLGFKDFETFKKEIYSLCTEYKDAGVTNKNFSPQKIIELCQAEAYALGYSACTGFFLYLVSLGLDENEFLQALLGYSTCLANATYLASLQPPC